MCRNYICRIIVLDMEGQRKRKKAKEQSTSVMNKIFQKTPVHCKHHALLLLSRNKRTTAIAILQLEINKALLRRNRSSVPSVLTCDNTSSKWVDGPLICFIIINKS